jgi:DNA adenine methylase
MAVSEATVGVRPPLKWHGGKHYVASKVLEAMPRHLHYVEPYFGGGQVLFRRDRADPRLWWDGPTSDGRKAKGVSEVVNDLDGDLMNFYGVLKDAGLLGQLKDWLDKTLFSEDEWRKAGEVLAGPPGDPVVRAGSLFVRVRQSMSGRRDTFCPTTRTRLRGGRNGDVYAWQNAIDGLPAVHERLRDVRVLNRPALDVIRQEDQPATLFYLDPPYVHETRTSTEVYGRFEMTLGDHRELLETVRGCRGKVILSGYDNGLYNTVLSDWTRYTQGLPNNAAGGASKRRMTEVLWCNF